MGELDGLRGKPIEEVPVPLNRNSRWKVVYAGDVSSYLRVIMRRS